MPTILNLLGIEDKVYTEGVDIFSPDIKKREYVFAQRKFYRKQNESRNNHVQRREHFEYGDKFVLRGGQWKYFLRTRYKDELYNLHQDPGELANLLDQKKAKGYNTHNFVKLINNWRDETPFKYETGLNISDEIREKLRSLGYVN
jgi:arylsulfatase A-like enzyme